MTTRYQKSQIEDVARIIAGAMQETADEGKMADRYMDDTTVENLANDFADLFAADNPRRCERCTAPFPRSEGEVCIGAKFGAPGDHQFSGFDRERFLAACGLESEAWPNAEGECSGSATCIDHPESEG